MKSETEANLDDFSVAAEIFRLLADPTRVGLLHALAGHLVARRPATVSQHLARLRVARLVTTRRDGTTVYYRLANEHVRHLVTDGVRHAEHLGPGVPAHHQEVDPDLE